MLILLLVSPTPNPHLITEGKQKHGRARPPLFYIRPLSFHYFNCFSRSDLFIHSVCIPLGKVVSPHLTSSVDSVEMKVAVVFVFFLFVFFFRTYQTQSCVLAIINARGFFFIILISSPLITFSLFLFSFLFLFLLIPSRSSCGENWNELAATKFRENHSIEPYLKILFAVFVFPPSPYPPALLFSRRIYSINIEKKESEGEKWWKYFGASYCQLWVIFARRFVCLLSLSLSDPICTLDGADGVDVRKQQKEIKLTEGYFKNKVESVVQFYLF